MKITSVIIFFKKLLSKFNWYVLFFSYLALVFVTPELDLFLQFLFFQNFIITTALIVTIVLFRIFILKSQNTSNFIADFKINFTLLKIKKLSIFLNFIKINAQKVFLYLVDYKTYKFVRLVKSFFSWFLSKTLLWRPLFKRFSYFGNYKSSRGKFINN